MNALAGLAAPARGFISVKCDMKGESRCWRFCFCFLRILRSGQGFWCGEASLTSKTGLHDKLEQHSSDTWCRYTASANSVRKMLAWRFGTVARPAFEGLTSRNTRCRLTSSLASTKRIWTRSCHRWSTATPSLSPRTCVGRRCAARKSSPRKLSGRALVRSSRMTQLASASRLQIQCLLATTKTS